VPVYRRPTRCMSGLLRSSASSDRATMVTAEHRKPLLWRADSLIRPNVLFGLMGPELAQLEIASAGQSNLSPQVC
jgi:hypothetical protein